MFTSLIRNEGKRDFLSYLKLRFEKIKGQEKYSPKWTFLSISLVHILENYFKWIISEKIPDLIDFFLSAENVLKECNFEIVLISERWGDKRTILALIAKNKGIPVLHIPHSVESGFMDGDKIVEPPLLDISEFPFYPTYELSSFKYQQRMQKKRGINQNKLFLTGIPRFGSFKLKSQESLYKARKLLGFSMDDEIVFIHFRPIFNYYYDKMRANNNISTFKLSSLYESFMKYILKRQNSKIVFKLRTSDLCNSLIYSIAPSDALKSVIIIKNNLQDILMASDAVVVTHSNIGIEALYYDTPVIVYNDPDKPSTLSIRSEKAVILINSPEEILPVLSRLRNDKKFRQERLEIQRDFLERNLPADNLTPSNRVTDVIFQLANKI